MVKQKARTVADFRAVHDRDVVVPNKIRVGLALLLKTGQEHWEYEGDFIKLAKISQADMGAYRDQFAAHIVAIPAVSGRSARRAWFGSAKVAAANRG